MFKASGNKVYITNNHTEDTGSKKNITIVHIRTVWELSLYEL